MSKCFSCGRSFNGSVKDLLRIYKTEYDKKGTERYYYKLSENGDVFICGKTSFKVIFDNEIKPNYINGAEFAHIREYNVK